MKALVVGGGGREHALAWKLARSEGMEHVFCAPGNAGTAREAGITNVALASDQAIVAFAAREAIDLTVIGPEAPLAAGLADRLQARGLTCLGPGREGARLEASKEYAKRFMQRHAIATGAWQAFTALEPALAFVRTLNGPVVVKADGLASGKGVVVAEDAARAGAALREMFDGRFGEAGHTVVVEEFLEGEEASFIVLTDGRTILPLASSQDHKARDEGDRGPNTGGMGAYSPAPVVDDHIHRRVMVEIIEPAVAGLRRDGVDYRGFLYAGLMIGADGCPRVLEFNCRLGDPETQPIMMRLRADLANLLTAAARGHLHEVSAQWDPRVALGVVLASAGYPGTYATGEVISGLEANRGETDGKIFHAGTRLEGDRVLTAGGRVLCAVGLGESVRGAAENAYRLADAVDWPSRYLRRDIGYRAMAREG